MMRKERKERRERKDGNGASQGIDRTTLRLAVFGIVIMVAFVALFSRLWYLQVLAAPDYRQMAKENRVRFIKSEPLRGRIIDRNGVVLVENETATAVTIDRQIVDTPREINTVLARLAEVLDESEWTLRQRMKSELVSPYKPVPVAENVPRMARDYILENQEDFYGAVDIEKIPARRYPKGHNAPHILGYLGEISPEQLKSEHFKEVRPGYESGDIVGRDGVEYYYDRFLRGTPELRKVIVNSSGDVLSEAVVREETIGNDLVLHLDYGIQELAEETLKAGIFANRGSYQSPAGAVVIMDPTNGGILGMASYPDFNLKQIGDGISNKEWKALGNRSKTPDDDAFINRAIQAQRAPGSTFKIVTAGAALATDVATTSTTLDCPGSKIYPPPSVLPEPGAGQPFNNWTSFDFGLMGFPKSLEVSCDTFYYELGWQLESTYGLTWGGDESERFQKYARLSGLGDDTGIDLPNELPGRIPDWEWCKEIWEATKDDAIPTCGTKREPVWLPGYTINMSIGQGDVLTTPLQMAVATSAVANGGTVWRPQIAQQLARPDENDVEQPVRTFEPQSTGELPLEDYELDVIQQGMVDVITGAQGTANEAFAGFPVSEFPIAGKTGTAELTSESTRLQDAWFVSYAPADDPKYVVVVYLEKSGHGGESAAPIAREIYEGLFGVDESLDIQLGQDASG